MFEDFELEQLDIDSAMEELSKDLKDDKDGLDDADVSSEALAAAALLDMTSESDIEELAASSEAMDEVSEMMGVAMERTIVRFDRKARLAHLSGHAQFLRTLFLLSPSPTLHYGLWRRQFWRLLLTAESSYRRFLAVILWPL